MKISKERLEKEAANTGFRLEILEKVIHLMGLLDDFMADPFLSSRIALKGGTALNLFSYDCPRLSVDIDINYIGSSNRKVMLSESGKLLSTIETICLDKEYISQHKPSTHAGGKWIWRYKSDLQGNPRIEIDLNFLTRLPLWNVTKKNSVALGSYQVQEFPVLDKHELSGGKLKALFSRHSSRDLFDTYHILNDKNLDFEKLRTAFIVYGGMSRLDWRTVNIDNIQFEWIEFKNMLLPMLRNKNIKLFEDPKKWAKNLLLDTREKLSALLPFRENEMEFLNALLDFGEIKPALLTNNNTLKTRIEQQPGLLWKAMHVKKHEGL